MDGIHPISNAWGGGFNDKQSLPPMPVLPTSADLASASNLYSYLQGTISPWVNRNASLYPLEKLTEIQQSLEGLKEAYTNGSNSVAQSVAGLTNFFSLLGYSMTEDHLTALSTAACNVLTQKAHLSLFSFHQDTAEPLSRSMSYLSSTDPKVQNAAVAAITLIQNSRKVFEEKVDTYCQSLVATPPQAADLPHLEELLTTMTQDMEKVTADLSNQMQQILSAVAATAGAAAAQSSTASGNVNPQYYSNMVYFYEVFSWFGSSGSGGLFSTSPSPLMVQLFFNAANNFAQEFQGNPPNSKTDPVGAKIWSMLNYPLSEDTGKTLLSYTGKGATDSSMLSDWNAIITSEGIGNSRNIVENLYNEVLGPNNWFDANGVNPYSSPYPADTSNSAISKVYQDLSALETAWGNASTAWQNYYRGQYGGAAWNGGSYGTQSPKLTYPVSQGVVASFIALATAITTLSADITTALKGPPTVYDGYLSFLNDFLNDSGSNSLDTIVALASSMAGKKPGSPGLINMPLSKWASKLHSLPFLEAFFGIASGSNTGGAGGGWPTQYNLLSFLGGSSGMIASILAADFKT